MRTLLIAAALAIALPGFSQSFSTNPASLGGQSNPVAGPVPMPSAIPQSSASATGSPVAHRWEPPFLLQTGITICISAITALIATWFRERGRKRELLQKEFIESIRELRGLCEDICPRVIEHLIAQPFLAKKQTHSHIEIMCRLKLCGNRMQRAAGLLDKAQRPAIEAEFLKWKGELTGGPFPVSKKEFASGPHDAAVIQVNAAQEKWFQYLDRLSRECMNGSIKIPLKPSA